jgi:hypothetical protein
VGSAIFVLILCRASTKTWNNRNLHIDGHPPGTHCLLGECLGDNAFFEKAITSRMAAVSFPASRFTFEWTGFCKHWPAMTAGLLFKYFRTPELMTQNIIPAFEALVFARPGEES